MTKCKTFLFLLIFLLPMLAIGQQHQISLGWNAPGGAVASYNVGRSLNAGGPYSTVNPVPVLAVSYTDSNVTGGTKYFYVVTSVDNTGVGSLPSNEVSATVPGATPPPGLAITTTSLPAGTVGTPYNIQLNGSGGVPPYKWAVAGLLSSGLSSTSAGVINGTPLAPQTLSLTIMLTDSASDPAATMTLPLSLKTAPTATYSWTVVPTSLSFTAAGTKTFTADDNSPAAQPFTLSTDAQWLTATTTKTSTKSTVSVTVNPSNLTAGTYTGHVTLAPNATSGLPVKSYIVMLTVSTATPPPPAITLTCSTSGTTRTCTIGNVTATQHGTISIPGGPSANW